MRIVLTALWANTLLLLCHTAISQSGRATLFGYIEDAATGEKLPGASIIMVNERSGTSANNYGFYTITVPASSSIRIIVSNTGYQPVEKEVDLTKDVQLNIKLFAIANLEEVIVSATRIPPIQSQTQMSHISVPLETVKSMPRFLGETDVLKTLQLLPGVSQGTEGSSGILVRGGGPEQNLILLDGTLIYNPSHFLGIFSTFNGDAIKNVELYKGGFPARFGGRLSSVVDLVMKDGNMKAIHGEGSIGLLASNLTLEGPIKKDRTSFLVSGRRTYLDLIAKPLIKNSPDNEVDGFAAYFYDINAKLHHIISDKNRLFASFFSGQDVFGVKTSYQNNKYTESNDAKIDWGNIIGTMRWNHVFNNRLFANTLLNYTQYKFNSKFVFEEKDNNNNNVYSSRYSSSIQDLGLRMDFDYRPMPEHNIKTGVAGTLHRFMPGALTIKFGDISKPEINRSFNNELQNSPELSAYAEDDWYVTHKLKFNIGLHASAFKAKTNWYGSVQPRIGIRYLLPAEVAFKASYAEMTQFVHFLTNNSSTLPTDLWVPSTDKIKPMHSRQVAIGFARNIVNNKIEASVEGYYKKMRGVIEYFDGASYINSNAASWDTKVEAGNATAWGAEILLQKKAGKTTGWIGYTLSWSDRQFPTINFGRTFFYKYDRRHDVEIVVSQKLGKRWELSGSWQFQTGSPYTLPMAQYEGTDGLSPANRYKEYDDLNHYDGRNTYRLLNYHRFDAGITYKRQKKNRESSWNLSAYNAYNRKNPFYYYIGRQYEGHADGTRVLKGITLLPIVPSISYRLKF